MVRDFDRGRLSEKKKEKEKGLAQVWGNKNVREKVGPSRRGHLYFFFIKKFHA